MNDTTAPFDRGRTFYDGRTIDTNNYDGTHLEGLVASFPDTDPSNRTLRRSAGQTICVLVRNTSGVTLPPKRAVAWASGYRGKRVDSITRTTAQEVAGIVDEHVGTGGVPNGDLFWLCVKGPSLVKAPLTGAEHAVAAGIAIGDMLVALTQATSSSTNAITGGGRFTTQNGTFSAAQTTDGTAILMLANKVGRAMSAITSGQTTDSTINVLAMIDLWPSHA